MKKIIFRADGNAKTGLGHLYRVFALIEMLKQNFECTIVTHESSLLNVIPKDYTIHTIPIDLEFENEPAWLKEFYIPADTVVLLDGYQFTSQYQKKIKELAFKLVYVDDLASEYMYADLVINHSPSAITTKYTSETYTRFALGTAFALVRPLFIEAAKSEWKITKMDTAFVCFGGSDQFNFTTLVCKVLLRILQIQKINVVVGEAFISSEIYGLQSTHPRLKILKNLSEEKLLHVMHDSHFAIVPTSTILFEVCCVKMPVLSGYYIDNQKEAYHAFIKENAIRGVDNFKKIASEDLEIELLRLLNSDNEMMIAAQSRLFDGQQKERLISILNTI